jgi:hypothetical protein
MSDRPAFYALDRGGWRDYWTLLHPPYTVWHLSYVVIGASLAPALDMPTLLWTLLAFLLAVGIAAHAFDELKGRPLGTEIPSSVLIVAGSAALVGALGIGVLATVWISPWIPLFVLAGGFLVVAYNLEVAGGRFHSDLWFAAAWGGFPVLTAAFAQTASVSIAAVLASIACTAVSLAQRALSTPVRHLRRRAASVEGRVEWRDGREERLDAAWLQKAPESALRSLSFGVPLLALALLAAALARP